MKINAKETRIKLGSLFGWEVVNIAENVIERIDEFDEDTLFDEIMQAVDDELIYTQDQWLVIGEYMQPYEIANNDYYDVINRFIEDIYFCCVVEYD